GWTAARLGHFAAYLADIAALRSACFGVATLCLVGLVALTV
ncbi:MAG: putative MAPEG superfamily protein, partial [Myxococcota bacterium]